MQVCNLVQYDSMTVCHGMQIILICGRCETSRMQIKTPRITIVDRVQLVLVSKKKLKRDYLVIAEVYDVGRSCYSNTWIQRGSG